MVSAAELRALHAGAGASNSVTDAHANGSNGNSSTSAPIMEDPFPSLTEDPFPPTPAPGAAFGASAAAAAAGPAGASPAPKRQGNAQPDFSSQAAFPSLGAGAAPAKGQWGAKSAAAGGAPRSTTWGSAPVIQRQVAQEIFTIPTSEDTASRLGAAMSKVQAKHRTVKVEASSNRKAGTTTFVIKGATEAAVKAARRDVTVALAKNVTLSTMIPASLRALVIGTKGKNVNQIKEQTGCRINIPRAEEGEEAAAPAAPRGEVDYDSEPQVAVTVEGDEINARQAIAMVNAIVAERTSRTTARITTVEHVFYPFIAGAKGANAAKLEQEIGGGDVTVRVPPRAAFLPPKEDENGSAAAARDLSIVVSGDRERVAAVVAAIEANVDELKRSLRTLNISIPKRQHRFLVGDAAQEILAQTGCSVELAPQDDPSDNVTIRGPQTNLPLALTAAMEKANAVKVEVVDVVAAHRQSGGDALEHAKLLLRWLSVSGKLPRSKEGVNVYTPRPAIVESTGQAQIEVVGSDAGAVSEARSQIDALVKSVPPSFVRTVDIDPLLHRFIIGKKGQGLAPYTAKGVDVVFPPVDSAGEGRSDVVLLLSGVSALPADKKAREAAGAALLDEVTQQLKDAAGTQASIKSEKLSVDAKHHRAIRGSNNTTLNAIVGEEKAVDVRFIAEDNVISVRGHGSEVDRVVAELKKVAKAAEADAIVNGHVEELHVDASHVPHLVGRGGSAVTKLREELGVRVDFEEAGGKKGVKSKVTLTGRKENVEEAKRRIQAQAAQLADETTVTLKVPQAMHGSIIGQGGKYVTRLQETYAVRINFPSQGGDDDSKQAQDEVVIRGGKKGVEGAKAEIVELLEFEKENNNVLLVPVSTKSVARIMGRGGANVNKIRDDTSAQIDVDRADKATDGTTQIKLRGTKKAIAEAKAAILAVVAEVDSEETFELTISPEYHARLIGPGGQNLRDIVAKAGSDDPKVASQLIRFPRRGDKPGDVVVIRGPSEIARSVKDELEKQAKELSDRVTFGVVVAPSAHRQLLGRIREIQVAHNVRINLPGSRDYPGSGDAVNAASLADAADNSVVKIIGLPAAAEAAAKEISETFTSVSTTMKLPRAAAVKIGNANLFRSLRAELGVNVDAPRPPKASAPKPAAAPARIDADEDDLAWSLTELSVSSDDSDEVTWTLSGKDEAALIAAQSRINSELELVGGAGATSATHEGRLTIPRSAVPRLIGKGGSGLRELQSSTNTLIEVPRELGGVCIIRGKETDVLEARDRIEDLVQGIRD